MLRSDAEWREEREEERRGAGCAWWTIVRRLILLNLDAAHSHPALTSLHSLSHPLTLSPVSLFSSAVQSSSRHVRRAGRPELHSRGGDDDDDETRAAASHG
jgi:hypothetical protein